MNVAVLKFRKTLRATLCGLSILVGFAPLVFAEHDSTAQHSSETKYVELNRIGDPAEVLEVKSEPSRSLQSGEVRVAMLAAPIHPANLLQISGNYGVDAVLPSTPGGEGVGRVLETSAEVAHLAVGQLVLITGGGTWREELVAPAARFIPLPDLGSPSDEVIEQLSMAAVNPLSALLMLTSFVELEPGDWLVHSAANSAVGGYIVQLAKQRGIKTINVVRREGLADDLKSKGADVVLIDGPDLTAQIASATGKDGVSLAIDAVGGETFSRLAGSLAHGGTVVSYGALSGQPVTISVVMTIFNDVRVRGFWLTKWFELASAEEKQAAFGQVIPLIASGAIKADIDSRYSIAEIKEAVTRAGQGRRSGKVLLVPNHGNH